MNSLASNKVTRVKQIINNIADGFSLDKLSKSPARFNLDKLEWFNSEYIKLLPLLEFSYRADKLKFKYKLENDTRIRIGDYVYLIDLKKNLIFGEKWEHIWPDGDGYFYPLGGGRDVGELSRDCVVREVLEESNGQIKINPEKLIPIITRVFKFNKSTEIEKQLWDAKEFNYYFYEIDSQDVNSCSGDNNANCCWQPLSQVLSQNKFITYSIWYNFCQENSLAIITPNQKDIQKLLAYKLDQNRIAKLNQIGEESSVIYNYLACEVEQIKWKKNTLEESKQKLKELYDKFINNDNVWEEFTKLYDIDSLNNLKKLDSLPQYLKEASDWWSNLIKQYLIKNNLDYGEFLWPLRLSLSGQSKSASAFEILVIIGREESCNRIKKYL